SEIAKRLSTDKTKIVAALEFLQSNQMIDYIKQTQMPQITFTTPRLDIKELSISAKNYQERKEVAIKKMESVIYYASANHKCRSEILLNYFGQKDTYRCGVCDVCLERNKLELSDMEFSLVSDQVKTQLKNAPMPLTALVNSITNVREDKIIKVLQWLMENGKVQPNKKNLLEWRK